MKFKALLIVLICFFYACTKDKTYFIVQDELYGYWDVKLLKLGEIDTTNAIMRDSTCFPRFVFYKPVDSVERIETSPGKNIPDSIFACFKYGSYGLAGTDLIILLHGSGHETGPFLFEGAVTWQILNYTSNTLYLKTYYLNQYWYLNIKKVI